MSEYKPTADMADICPDEDVKGAADRTPSRSRKRWILELAIFSGTTFVFLVACCLLTALVSYRQGVKHGLAEQQVCEISPDWDLCFVGEDELEPLDPEAYWNGPLDSDVVYNEDEEIAATASPLYRRGEEAPAPTPAAAAKGHRYPRGWELARQGEIGQIIRINSSVPNGDPIIGQKIYLVPAVQVDAFCGQRGFTSTGPNLIDGPSEPILKQPTSGIHKLPDLNLDGKTLSPSQQEEDPAPKRDPPRKVKNPFSRLRPVEPNPSDLWHVGGVNYIPGKALTLEVLNNEAAPSAHLQPPSFGTREYEKDGRKIIEHYHPNGFGLEIHFPPDDPVARGIGGLEGDVSPPVPKKHTYTTYQTTTPKDKDGEAVADAAAAEEKEEKEEKEAEAATPLAKRDYGRPPKAESFRGPQEPKSVGGVKAPGRVYPIPAGPDSHRAERHDATPGLNFPTEVYSNGAH
ncbi:hypothetical protein B0T19DRAFT_241784 [Cercophora scortea]|uniref:Uncharacterized protein n=1 Tax=Cercophora scortea TaxID=314031 RepID=A0AAE0M6N2_9PEZI|nr:hypothetical protein B0T19DRAFT_241784 [Cercophora scortea]